MTRNLLLKLSFSFLVSLLVSASLSLAGDRQLILDAIEWSGSERLSRSFFEDELGLRPNTSLSQNKLEALQTQLLGTGLFRSARLFLQKGQAPGHAVLSIELEDDPSVFGRWAMGAQLSLNEAQFSSRTLGSTLQPTSIKGMLISRNLFGQLHRASTLLDIDSEGTVQGAQIAYGFPRFSQEDSQFDAELEVINPQLRYLDASAFGVRAEALWTLGSQSLDHWQWGVSYASNQDERFGYQGLPKSIIGPKLGYERETRLLGFRPSQGYRLASSMLFTSAGLRAMAYAAEAAYTHEWNSSSLTAETRMESVGLLSIHIRNSLRWDVSLPIWKGPQDPIFYIQGLQGQDRYRDQSLEGSELRVGWRLHSEGFIADISFAYRNLPTWPDGTPLREESP